MFLDVKEKINMLDSVSWLKWTWMNNWVSVVVFWFSFEINFKVFEEKPSDKGRQLITDPA